MLPQRKHQKNVAPSHRFSVGPHARLLWVRVCHDSGCTQQNLLDFLTRNAMLPAFGPVTFIPVEARTMFAFIPCNIATFATDARGAPYSSSTNALSSAQCRRRRTTLSDIASTYFLDGHDGWLKRLDIKGGMAGRLHYYARSRP